MANTPGDHPHDPDQKPGTQDTKDSFYDVLLWVLRIALILMVVLTIINFSLLAQSKVPFREITSLSKSDPIPFDATLDGILEPVPCIPSDMLRPKMNATIQSTDYTHFISISDETIRRYAYE